MIVRILIFLILLLSVLNIVGQPKGTIQTSAATQKIESLKSPRSLSPIIIILSALTVLLLSRNYLNRQLNKIQAAAFKPKLSKRFFGRVQINPPLNRLRLLRQS
jgi:hypothetical protein